MKMAILSGGPFDLLPNLKDDFFSDVSWVGVDRGTLTLLQAGITPVRAFGDFDSISYEDFQVLRQSGIPLSTFEAEKDATDLELALDWALSQKPDHCYLVGATGGRLDHMLVNIQFLIKGLGGATKVHLLDQQNRVTLLDPGAYNIVKRPEFNYISLIAYTPEVRGLTLEGFKYPLVNQTLTWGSSLCVSNELHVPLGVLQFTQGLLLLIYSRDQK
jgi:thiamine pyrophosphokinase